MTNSYFSSQKRSLGKAIIFFFGCVVLLWMSGTSVRAQTFYVSSGYQVLKVGPTGSASTYATFNPNAETTGLVFDANNNLFVGDVNYSVIREVSPTGMLSVFATINGTFGGVTGLAIDVAGNLYAANGNIYKVTPTGVVTTFATLPANSVPQGLAFDGSGNLFVANSNTGLIDKITVGGVVSTFATLNSNSLPYGLAFDGNGNLYVAGQQTSQISKITPLGGVSAFATLPTNSYPEGLSFDNVGNLYTGNIYTNQISKISPDGTVSIFASNVQGASFLTSQPIPEPTTPGILLLVGCAAIAWKRMRVLPST